MVFECLEPIILSSTGLLSQKASIEVSINGFQLGKFLDAFSILNYFNEKYVQNFVAKEIDIPFSREVRMVQTMNPWSLK